MSISNQSLYSTRILQSLLEALRNLRHAVERASTNPEYLSDGLRYTLAATEPHLLRVFNQCDQEAEANELFLAVSDIKQLERISAESVSPLLAEIDRLLICLPLNNRPVGKKQRMPLSEAEPRIRKYLNDNPRAKRREVAEAVGCSHGLVDKSRPWKAKVKEGKANRQPRGKKIGLELALNEKAQQNHRQAE